MALFDLSDVQAAYNGTRVLQNITLSIKAGERIALVGRSGTGKSTLLRLLHSRKKEDIALVPQDLGLVKALSVFHNVYMGRLNRNSSWYNVVNLIRPFRSETKAVNAILEKLRLTDKMFVPVGELSGGQQQRTAVARALYQDRPVFLGDEPVSAVDILQARTVLKLIIENHETTVLAMHDVELAIQFSDRIIGISGGGIVLDKPSAKMKPGDLDALYKH